MATYVLIPGGGGLGWTWHLVETDLRARGHDVVTVDLPADDDSAGLHEYADTVVAAIGDRSRDLVVVAHSLGALTAPLVCERVPVDLLVLLTPMIPSPGETGGDWWANTRQEQAMREQAERDGRADDTGDDMSVFFHDVPPDLAAEVVRRERDQSGTPLAQPWPLEAWPDVPTRVLLCRHDRLFPPEFQRRVARERLAITPDEMDGGHLVALSRPEDLAERLEAFRTANAGTAAPHPR